MKKRWLLLSLLYGLAAQANPCTNKYATSDKELPGTNISKYNCQLLWKDPKNGLHGLEIIYQAKGCAQLEGGTLKDCIHTRYCPYTTNGDEAYGTPIYYKKGYFDLFCTKDAAEELVPILGLEEEVNRKKYRAYMKCVNKKPVGILLQSGTGKEKLCPIPKLK